MLTHKNKLGIVALVALVLAFIWVGCAFAAEDDLDRAMQAFVDAVKSKNPAGVLSAFSRTSPWQNVEYGTDKPGVAANRVAITYNQLSNDFSQRKGWYQQFLGTNPEPELEGCYTLADIIKKVPKWYKNGNTFGISTGKSPSFYIKWRPQGGNWVIAEIGNTRP